jgi:hypothetical protein
VQLKYRRKNRQQATGNTSQNATKKPRSQARRRTIFAGSVIFENFLSNQFFVWSVHTFGTTYLTFGAHKAKSVSVGQLLYGRSCINSALYGFGGEYFGECSKSKYRHETWAAIERSQPKHLEVFCTTSLSSDYSKYGFHGTIYTLRLQAWNDVLTGELNTLWLLLGSILGKAGDERRDLISNYSGKYAAMRP